jgi:hypothetical protein
MPVGFQITRGVKEVAKLRETSKKILQCNLDPWQKHNSLKSFYFPSLNLQMRTAHLQKGDWTKLDEYIRASINRMLNVSQEASNHYIYGPAKQGCAGIPEIASEYYHQLIDNAFKLLTSKDSGTKELAYEDLQTTVQKRIGHPTDQQDLGAYMSGNNEGEFRRDNNTLSTTWTKASIASKTREVEWTFENTKRPVSFDGMTLHDKHRRNVLSSLTISQKARHNTRLCEMLSQGKAMECVATDPASSHSFQTGLYTRVADWRFIHRARLN